MNWTGLRDELKAAGKQFKAVWTKVTPVHRWRLIAAVVFIAWMIDHWMQA